jgi:hypothetical protein
MEIVNMICDESIVKLEKGRGSMELILDSFHVLYIDKAELKKEDSIKKS